MGVSFVVGVCIMFDLNGWFVVFGDMLWIVVFIYEIVMCVFEVDNVLIVVFVYCGVCGYLVGFVVYYFDVFVVFDGDMGVCVLFVSVFVILFDVDDFGILCDVDMLVDLC